VPPLWVFCVYKQVADPGDVMIQKQGFSIVDTHEPAFAMSFAFGFQVMIHPNRNQIFLEGRHREVRRFVSPGLHHIKLVSGHCGMSRHDRHTLTWFGSVPPGLATIICHRKAFKTTIYWERYPRAATKWWRRGQCWSILRLDDWHAF
jgi:hypothetical protein